MSFSIFFVYISCYSGYVVFIMQNLGSKANSIEIGRKIGERTLFFKCSGQEQPKHGNVSLPCLLLISGELSNNASTGVLQDKHGAKHEHAFSLCISLDFRSSLHSTEAHFLCSFHCRASVEHKQSMTVFFSCIPLPGHLANSLHSPKISWLKHAHAYTASSLKSSFNCPDLGF